MAELFRSLEDLIDVLERPKRVILPPRHWTLPDTKHGQRHLILKASLSDGSSTLRGIGVRVQCSPEGFDLPVSVVLLADFRNRPHAMARIDINGQRHENRLAICGEWQFRDAGVTHFHDTRLHVGIPIEQLFGGAGDLPVARPIGDMPKVFSGAMEKCGELLHIENLNEVEEPQWQPRQFPF